MISERVRQIGMSQTLRISALAQEMRSTGIDVLDFSAGQPDFPTPELVKAAGRRAIDEDKTRYTANAGLLELRRAIAEQIERQHEIAYAPEQILVSSGAKASLYFALMALVDPGDEVLMPQPYWVSYPEQIRLALGVPVPVACSEQSGFKLTPADLERALGPRTRGLILNYPCNPTGACFTRDELAGIAELCLRHGLWVIADEIYSRLIYDGRRFASIGAVLPEMVERTVMVDGVSKTYSMTGWRIGYAAAPQEIISGMGRLQSHATSNATSISQWASLEALQAAEAEVDRRRAKFELRRDEIVRRLRELDDVSCPKPEGAFYVFPNVAAYLGRTVDGRTIDTSADLAQFLLERARVAVVPGEAFGSPSHIRVSYAVSVERIREGVARIAEALAVLR